MKKHAFIVLALCLLSATGSLHALEQNGENVIAHWEFTPGHETEDSSGNGHSLTIQPEARCLPDGIAGRGKKKGDAEDVRQGALVFKKAPELTPKGAFTCEMSFKLAPHFADCQQLFLIDNKAYFYESPRWNANQGYCFYLSPTSAGCRFMVSLGFGKDSVWARSVPVKLSPDTWYKTAFAYDGKGLVKIFLDGKQIYHWRFPERGDVAEANFSLALAERACSTYYSFAGTVDDIRLLRGIPKKYSGELKVGTGLSRTAFYRLESDAELGIELSNDTISDIDKLSVKAMFQGKSFQLDQVSLKQDEKHIFAIPVDTTLKAGEYSVELEVDFVCDGKLQRREERFSVALVNRQLPFMPVLMWGEGDIARLKDIGFTHDIRGYFDFSGINRAGKPIDMATIRDLTPWVAHMNERTREGVNVCIAARGARFVADSKNKDYRILDRKGNIRNEEYHRFPDASHPDMLKLARNIGESIAITWNRFPIYDLVHIGCEVRDHTAINFAERPVKAAEEFIGGKIPELIDRHRGMDYRTIPGFPKNRVVKDDDPYMKFYTWFWKVGDGWNLHNEQLWQGLQAHGRKVKAFLDPAVRVPSVWGSGRSLDYLQNWTYTYPDPLKIGQCTDELLAMAAGQPGQEVMKMTQIIWYRSQTTVRGNTKDPKQWEKDIPEADYITIAPDHLEIALWSMISRPIKGIMYHGWQSLVDCQKKSGYCYTNAETGPRLKALLSNVVKPLGAMLLQVPDKPADIAILASFTSQMLAERGSWGWSRDWTSDLHLVMQWASFQPKVIFEEEILRDHLAGIKILLMPHCDVLPEAVVKEIQAFQSRGGIVITDQVACPAIVPDHIVPIIKRSGRAQEGKEKLQACAAELKKLLGTIYDNPVDSDNPDVVPRLRQFGSSLYLFTINDKRTYGDYVGQYGFVMEKGLPTEANVKIDFTGHAYDLVAHRKLEAFQNGDKMILKQTFAPAEGKLVLLTKRPIEKVAIQLPESARLGDEIALDVVVTDAQGKAIDAVLPIRLSIVDPEGNEAEFSGYHAAVHGLLQQKLTLASNDISGTWTASVTDLASGLKSSRSFHVSKP